MKKISSILLAFSLGITQTSHAKNSDSEATISNIRTKLMKNNNEFENIWLIHRANVPKETRTYIDTWVLQNPRLKIDSLELIPLKCSEGTANSCFRALTKVKNKNLIIEFNEASKQFASINGIRLNSEASTHSLKQLHSELASLDSRTPEKLRISRTPLNLDKDAIAKLDRSDIQNQWINIRLLMQSSERVMEKRMLNKTVQIRTWWMNEAYATDSKNICLTKSGYVSKRVNDICLESSEAQQGCLKEQYLCNPQLYGFTGTGSLYCRKSTESCEQISPLRKDYLKQDAKRLLSSLEQASKNPSMSEYVSLEAQQNIERSYADYINEASSFCESENPQSRECRELLQRRANYNSFLMDLKGKSQKTVDKNSKKSKGESNDSALISQTDEAESCGWWCRNQSWALPVGIVGGTIVGMVAICKFTSFKMFGICGEKGNSQSENSESSTSNPISIIEPPTQADYSSGVR